MYNFKLTLNSADFMYVSLVDFNKSYKMTQNIYKRWFKTTILVVTEPLLSMSHIDSLSNIFLQ